MTLKIECLCGLKFAFDVEPENGRMPVPVACPQCDRDATETANAALATQIAGARSIAPKVQVPGSLPASGSRLGVRGAGGPPLSESPASTPAQVRPVASSETAAQAPAQPSVRTGAPAVRCSKHPGIDSTETCFVCAKPICPQCMAQFGFLCSVYCTEQARKKEIVVPEYAGQKSVQWREEVRTGNRLIQVLAAVAVLTTLSWAFHKFYLSQPRPVFSLPANSGAPFTHAQFIDATRLFTVTPQRIAVRHWNSDKEVWSADIRSPDDSSARSTGSILTSGRLEGGNVPDLSRPHVRIVGPDVWVATGSHVLKFDLQSGVKKSALRVPQPVDQWAGDEKGFMAVGSTNQFHRQVSRVTFETGTFQTDTVRLKPKRTAAGDCGAGTDWMYVPLSNVEFIPAGSGVVAMDVRLTESRIVERMAVKQRAASSLEREGGARQSDTEAIVGEFINEGAAPISEDFSIYEVNLRRLFSTAAPWIGPVSGRPVLFPLKTVDVLVAGTNLYVFDKNNRKLWESKLTYRVPMRYDRGVLDPDDDGPLGGSPAIEDGSRLYFTDQGNVSAYDLRDGRVAWRLPSVGTQEVLPVGGGIYVSTTDAGPESIRYSKDFTLKGKATPIVYKVDAASGKILWSQARLADQFRASGPYLYGAMSKSYLLDNIGADADSSPHFYLRRINPGNGKILWEYYQRYAAESFDARGKMLLLRSPKEVTLLRYH